MTSLDDAARRRTVDPDDALGDVEGAAAQWSAAREHAVVRADLGGIDAVVVAGMGGSGIAADIAAALAGDRLAVPLVVHKGYGLPAWAGPRTLVAAVSYSGGTEETLSAAQVALDRGCRLLAVSSGGRLGALADERGFPAVRVPGGGQPRHSTGWLTVPLLAALDLAHDLDEAIDVLAAVAAAGSRDVATEANPSKRLGARLASGATPVLYGTGGLGAVAVLRGKGQLSENAKLHALTGVVPELCHNDVVGWEGEPAVGRGVVWLRDPAGEHPRDARRAELVEELIDGPAAWQERIMPSGVSPIARLASLLQQVDLASVYAAHARGVDPTPVASIDRLKRDLGPVQV